MYGLKYPGTYALDPVPSSRARMWMALSLRGNDDHMLIYMPGMYSDRKANLAIFRGAVLTFADGSGPVRTQVTVGDAAWMKAMGPDHSIAILTSERAGISGPRAGLFGCDRRGATR